MTSWWFQPLWKIWVKNGNLPQKIGVNRKKYLSCHHPDDNFFTIKNSKFQLWNGVRIYNLKVWGLTTFLLDGSIFSMCLGWLEEFFTREEAPKSWRFITWEKNKSSKWNMPCHKKTQDARNNEVEQLQNTVREKERQFLESFWLIHNSLVKQYHFRAGHVVILVGQIFSVKLKKWDPILEVD